MKAMILKSLRDLDREPSPLTMAEINQPSPGQGQVLLRVRACGVCHTELDEIEGRTPPPHLPVVLGHEVVGEVVELGPGVTARALGDRVGVGWIYSSCGRCEHCQQGEENLCAQFQATGRDADGGYAQYMVAPQDSAHPIPAALGDTEAAPLLCAGAIGYRSLRLTGLQDGQSLGLTGFGASAHLVLKMLRISHPASEVYVFARSQAEREFARELGAVWAGDTTQRPPRLLDAIIDTTPAWLPVVEAMANLEPGGRLVINAIRKEERDKEALLGLDYTEHLWMEKEIKSVANVAQGDISACLRLAGQAGIRPEVKEYALEEANQALLELKQRKIRGAKVLRLA